MAKRPFPLERKVEDKAKASETTSDTKDIGSQDFDGKPVESQETHKGKLQSVNEELATVNSELQTKVANLSRTNNDMNDLLSGTGIATVFVDQQLHIMRFTPTATRILSDVGRPVANIVSKLVGYDRLVADTQTVLNTLVRKEMEVQTTDGKWYTMCIQPYRTIDNVIEGAVITFVDITEMKRTQEALTVSEIRYHRLFGTAKNGILILDAETGKIMNVNPFLIEMLGYSQEQFIEKAIWDIGLFKDVVASRDNFLELQQKEYIRYEDLPFETADGRRIDVEFISNVYSVDQHKVIQCDIRDITDRKRVEEGKEDIVNELKERVQELAFQNKEKDKRAAKLVIANKELVLQNEEKDKRAAELVIANAYLENLINYANAPIIVLDPQLHITFFNHAFEFITGRSEKEVLGKSLDILFPPEKASKSMKYFENSQKEKRWETLEIEIIHVDGSFRTLLWNSAIIYDSDGITSVSIISQGQDITDRKKAEKEIHYLSYHDQLTGLYNRRFYEAEIKRLDTERNLPMTIVMGDVNGLKLINDSFGHVMGDEFLKKVAEVMKKGCRADDIIARLGGDEFVIILPKTDAFETEQIIKRINALSLKEKVGTIDISISFGYETKNNEEEKIQEVFKKAEDHMYKKKLFESPSMRGKTIGAIISTLHEKNKREEQHSHRVSALCKRMGEALGLPEHKIEELKSVGLLHDIGKIVIDENILNKPGKLTDDEWKEIKCHPEIGY